ncbi:MAG: amino acid carrier protein [Synergistes sp.]|nr:amino acid carrier protein [Synergistes sp.]
MHTKLSEFGDESLMFGYAKEESAVQAFENIIYPIVCDFNSYLGNYILVFLLVGVGLWYSIKTHFVQVRCFGEGWRNIFRGKDSVQNPKYVSMTSFQALATAVSAQVGTGNVVGASGAILTGGPGAIFWMWIIAFLGMATVYSEAVLAIETRRIDKDGTIHGGPVYYITTAFKSGFGRFLAAFFAAAIISALGFMGCMVLSNSIGATIHNAFGVPSPAVGIALALICALIFLGGVHRLALVAEKLAPLMVGMFMVGSFVVLFKRVEYIPETFGMIFRYAFEPQAIIGGSFGTAIKAAVTQGVKRGLFSNEAGMGSTPHAHAQAQVETPHQQGAVAMIGVFIDTFVVLTLNALVIISTMYTADGPIASGFIPEYIGKTNLAQLAFGSVFGEQFGAVFVAVCLFCFAFTSILGWNFFGKVNALYLFGKNNPKKCVIIYSLISMLFIFMGTFIQDDLVWELQDMCNNFMVLPNIIALFALTNIVVRGALNKGARNEKEQTDKAQ